MKRLIIPVIIVLMIAPFLLIAQEDETPDLLLSVSSESCVLEFIEYWPEATPEAEPEYTPEPGTHDSVIAADSRRWLPRLPHYLLSDDCDDVEPLLTVPSNGTLWLALLYDDEWLPLDTLEDDPNPPQLDGRGRYFGCAIPDEGVQVCYVLVTLDEVDYLVAVPLWVGDAYITPEPADTEEPEVQETPEGDNPPSQDTGGNSPPPTQAPQPTATDDDPPPGDGNQNG